MTDIEHPDITNYRGGDEYAEPDVKCPCCGAKLDADTDMIYMDIGKDVYCSHCATKIPAWHDDYTMCILCHADLDSDDMYLYYTSDGGYIGCSGCVTEYSVEDYIAEWGTEWGIN